MNSEGGDDAVRREINMFAAMANGEEFQEGSIDSEFDMQLPSGAGTFAINRSPEADDVAAKSNLDAAAASLTDNTKLGPQVAPLPPNLPDFSDRTPPSSSVPRTAPIPMYTERVKMPRPLFFGPIVPPRVLKEARKIVSDSLKDLDLPDDETFQLSHLPPGVRNLVSAIDTFGYGLSAMTDRDESKGEFWRGDPYVSSYHPVFGETTRLEREQMRLKNQEQRSAKVPRTPHVPAGSLDCGDPSEMPDQDKNEETGMNDNAEDSVARETKSQSSKSMGGDGGPHPAVMTDSTLFSQWAGGDVSPTNRTETQIDAPDAHGIQSDDNPSTSSRSSLLNREPDADTGSSMPVVDKNLFSKWAGGSMEPSSLTSPVASPRVRTPRQAASPLGGSNHSTASPIETREGSGELLSEQEVFAKWARGEEKEEAEMATDKFPSRPFDTFKQVQAPEKDDSDDDSVVGSELKKKVGINDNLDAAVASLAEGSKSSPTDTNAGHENTESISADEANALLSQSRATSASGRPLSNFELTGGCVPLYACDDGSLPIESDLELYQTRDEQLRHMESCKSEEIINKHTFPNLFGTVACPNPSLSPDDNHRWNSRMEAPRTPLDFHGLAGTDRGDPTVLSVPTSPGHTEKNDSAAATSPSATGASSVGSDMDELTGGSIHSPSSVNNKYRKRERRRPKPKAKSLDSGRVYGWWNVADESGSRVAIPNEPSGGLPHTPESTVFMLPPQGHALSDMAMKTRLSPSPEKLRQENRPLSNMHSAFKTEQTLPFLSDRSPSHRYLQIDTQVVGFPAVEELEPLFCSLAIYHVEPLPGDNPRAIPMPNLQRCGRITEFLNFDVVSDPEVEMRCAQALWPFSDGASGDCLRTLSTRCGVFPLPSSFNIANLYAILVVHKVLSDEADLAPYLKENKGGAYDVDRLRSRAEKASLRRGRFLMPFCFGVAPLVQVLGTDVPNMARSRAVQIPLFHLVTGQGDRPIIDQIMVMLNPKGELSPVGSGGRAANSNGGTAFFVMRNFGYLGLHSVVFGKSSLARDRLVDFSGEIQIRRDPNTSTECDDPESHIITDGMQYILPSWHCQIVSEPTSNGGRIVADDKSAASGSVASARSPTSDKSRPFPESQSKVYAQELAPVPLQLASSEHAGLSSGGLSRAREGRISSGVEPLFRTSFCNELLCYPQVLQNGPKGCIVVKTELREIEWSDVHQAYLARVPATGPSLHNPRRGAYLVQDAYTSCAVQTANPQFLDEFKFKLPLILEADRVSTRVTRSTYALLFSVCHVHLKPRRSWTFGRRDDDEERRSRVDVLACGFLPITTSRDSGCLIDNGVHDVRVAYSCRKLPPDEITGNHGEVLILKMPPETRRQNEVSLSRGKAFVRADETENLSEGTASETLVVDTDDILEESCLGSESAPSDANTDSEAALHPKLLLSADGMTLQVRIVVHSAIHPQSATLSEFFRCVPDGPVALSASPISSLSLLTPKRSDLLAHIRSLKAISVNEPVSDELEKLFVYTSDVSKSQLCSQAESTTHFFRLVGQLLKVMLVGNGAASLVWSDPASCVSLRVQAFASLIQIVNSVNAFMSKHGTKVLDMRSRWSMTDLSKVTALAIDEDDLMANSRGVALQEVFYLEAWLKQRTAVDTSLPMHKNGSLGTMATEGSRMSGTPTQSFASPAHNAGFSESLDDFLSGFKSEKIEADEAEGPRNRAATLPYRAESARTPALSSKEHDKRMVELKIDTKADFQSALRAGNVKPLGQAHSDTVATSSTSSSSEWGGLGAGRRKFMTMPALSTIREVDDTSSERSKVEVEGMGDSPELAKVNPSSARVGGGGLDTEVIRVPAGSTSVKKMRVPTLGMAAKLESTGSSTGSFPSDEQILSAGSAFLDVVGEGYESSSALPGDSNPRHRKRRSLCSIDWASSDLDEVLSKDTLAPSPPPAGKVPDSRTGRTTGDKLLLPIESGLPMTALIEDEKNTVPLPSFVDRLINLGKTGGKGRWNPYMYEVIIYQWVALLDEQRKIGNKSSPPRGASDSLRVTIAQTDDCLKDAAVRARGATIACAPVLFELIKHSLARRTEALFRALSTLSSVRFPPLARLDQSIVGSLEHLICMLTDACLDVRNFDSQEFRWTSIGVNDSIVRFLIDAFALLETKSVHRLILGYLSRFVVRDGKLWQDRDSKIGLKCSDEVAKLRMNAVTALVRFSDFTRVSSPQLDALGDWSSMTTDLPRDVYDNLLEQFASFGIPGFAENDGPVHKSELKFPPMQPHWLVELVTDICLSGTDHVEQTFQNRASSLLYELFWALSQDAQRLGTSPLVASMFVPFLMKILWHVGYWSSFPAKSQLRRDMLPCALYVLQCAPVGLIRAAWRKLLTGLEGRGGDPKNGGVEEIHISIGIANPVPIEQSKAPNVRRDRHSPDIVDMFGLLNLALATCEYDCNERQHGTKSGANGTRPRDAWKKEFLPGLDRPNVQYRHIIPPSRRRREKESSHVENTYSTTPARRWHAHDASMIVISTCRQIVREMFSISRSNELNYSFDDTVVFVRAATSVYLSVLVLRQSDVAVVRALEASKEILGIFGIDIFLRAVGNTLQHWMRVVTIHCGARRQNVRITSSDFLGHLLRRTWDNLGSFTRIRVPLLAVQLEVMERIVATAAARYYLEQRIVGTTTQYLSNDSAEASLSPLWRTLDRLHHQSASQNSAFRSAIIGLAEKMKKLYRAYIAEHALIIISRAHSGLSARTSICKDGDDTKSSAMAQSRRIIVHRIVSNSAGYSRHFLGLGQSKSRSTQVAHYEAIEDAFLDAAHVFSSSELPQYRAAWLRRLAEFHSTRSKYAEEAMCRYHVYLTLKAASTVRQSLWSTTPFVPWTNDGNERFHVIGEGVDRDAEEIYDVAFDVDGHAGHDLDTSGGGRQIESSNSFRRIFYRVPNSIRMRTGDWELGGKKSLFYGVALPSEFSSSSPWLSKRELSEDMTEEAELSGELFLKARITESSRYMWSLTAKIYAENFSYEKLSLAYRRLARVMSHEVPVIDTNHQSVELSHTLGRFYKLHFHGGAPDELVGLEFVHRAGPSAKLDTVGEDLRVALRSILPEHIPLNIQLEDGRQEQSENVGQNAPTRRPLGPTPVEPMKVRITPLRVLQKSAQLTRGTAEWFQKYAELPLSSTDNSVPIHHLGSRPPSPASEGVYRGQLPAHNIPKHRHHSRSHSSPRFLSSGSMSSTGSMAGGLHSLATSAEDIRGNATLGEEELVGVDLFCFVHPAKGIRRSSRDWLKPPGGDVCLKFLNKRYVGVDQPFPACGTRQIVNFRADVRICSLEAGLDAVCSWCSVLFRTAVATNGDAVLGGRHDQGIGTAAARIVSESIHRSRVREIGLVLLHGSAYVADDNETAYGGFSDRPEYRLSEDQMKVLQKNLARSIVVFVEILHLLIGRNREMLLEAMHTRNRVGTDDLGNSSFQRRPNSLTSTPEPSGRLSRFSSIVSGVSSQGEGFIPSDMSAGLGASTISGHGNDRTEKAIAVHRELQRSFASMVKALHSNVSGVLGDETPRWFKQACSEGYFKSNIYKQTKIRMSDELCFSSIDALGTTEIVVEEDGVPIPMFLDQNTMHSRDSSGSFHEGSERSVGRSRPAPSPMQSGDSSLFQV